MTQELLRSNGMEQPDSYGYPPDRVEKRLRRRFPDDPLLWREDWAAGHIEPRNLWEKPGNRLPSHTWGLFFLATVFPLLFLTDRWSGGRFLAVLFVAILILGAGIQLRRFLVARRQQREFGPFTFVPDTPLPLVPGGMLRGTFRSSRPLSGKSAPLIGLAVLRHHPVSGPRVGVLASVSFPGEMEVQVDQDALHLALQLPEGPPSGREGRLAKITWMLNVIVPGDFPVQQFELPVVAGPVAPDPAMPGSARP